MITPTVRYIAATGGNRCASVQLACRVKPGVTAGREGIASVTAHNITVCVAARAQDGAANTAVCRVIAAALTVPKTRVEILKGLKAREKIVAVQLSDSHGTRENIVEQINIMLLESVSSRQGV